MRVAWVVPGGVDRSGTHRVIPVILGLLERIAARHDVNVVALRQESEPGDWELLGARIHNVGARPRRLRALGWLVREHRREPFELIHGFWAIPQGVVAAAAGRWLGVPSIVELWGGEMASLPEIDFGALRHARGRAWIRFVGRGADRICAVSDDQVRVAAGMGISAQKMPHGVAVDRWPPRAPRRRNPGSRARLIHVGTLTPVKDHPTLLRAAALLRERGADFHLDLVGEDVSGGRIQRMASELSLDLCVTFHGFLPQDRLRPLMEAADVHVVSSRSEGVPVAMLEAAVAGVPSVGSAVGYMKEWSPAAASAVPPADPRALADAIEALLRDEDHRLAIAAAAHERAVHADADAMADAFDALYREVAARRG